ncbi:MAG: hypothetical protein GEV06_03555 [Luteitalea sp.]|nr:hypothetical protein [Luteitalea sp.]
MRLLFDEQLSEDLCETLSGLYPRSLHVRRLGLGGAPDSRVWQAAREHEALLVTKDEDFHRLVLLQGAPPKVIWIRLGNCSTQQMAELLRRSYDGIRRFSDQEEATILELG